MPTPQSEILDDVRSEDKNPQPAENEDSCPDYELNITYPNSVRTIPDKFADMFHPLGQFLRALACNREFAA